MSSNNDSAIVGVVKGVGAALIATLFGIVILGFIVKSAAFSGAVIGAVNQFLKIISLFLGCLFSSGKGVGLIKGLIIGALYTVIVNLIFSLVLSVGIFDGKFFIDLIFAMIVGGLSGVVTANVKR
jgi:putative membrane protein (TIGR04086 family)